MPSEVSVGEPSFTSFPFSELSHSEDNDVFAKERIRHFSRSVLSAEAWFHIANELIAAADLLEPHVERFWNDVRSLFLAVDQTSDAPSKHQTSGALSKHETSDASSKHNLINQHMMLAGFAIENLCKGYLVGRLSDEEQKAVQVGVLPKFLKSHNILKLVEQTGMTLADTQKYLLNRIADAVSWRGRYPSATSHESIRPFAQIGSDIRHIKTLLQKLRRHVGAKD
jgi:hypothetical protein